MRDEKQEQVQGTETGQRGRNYLEREGKGEEKLHKGGKLELEFKDFD